MKQSLEEKNINNSIEFIRKIECKLPFVLKGSHTPFHQFLGKIFKADNFCYKVEMQTTPREFMNMEDVSNVELETSEYKLVVNNIILTSISESKVIGEISDFTVNILNDNENKYFRLVIKPITEISFNYFYNYFYTYSVKTFRSREYIKAKINNNNFDFYLYLTNGIKYIVIESREKLNYKNFYRSVYSILLSHGFISGKFAMDDGYFFAFDDNAFTKNVFTKYVKFAGSIDTIFHPIYTNAHGYLNDTEKANNINSMLKGITEKEFSNLCSLAYTSPEFSSAMYLFLEGSKGSLQLTASSYAICLETLTSIIAEENQDKLTPIKSKRKAKQVRREMIKLLDNFKTDIKDGYEIIKNKINNLNQPTNRDKLIKPFEILQITLTEDDISCIEKRNDFLHGRMPDIEMGKIIDKKEFGHIFHISLKLCVLVSSLILKRIGFSGMILNHPQIHSSISKINLNEEIYRKI